MRNIQDLALKPKDRDAILTASRLLRERFPIENIILFGSKARGEDDDESDIDLLILTSRKLAWRERQAITDALFPVQLAHDVLISTLVAPASEWSEGIYQVLPIHDEVERDGVAA